MTHSRTGGPRTPTGDQASTLLMKKGDVARPKERPLLDRGGIAPNATVWAPGERAFATKEMVRPRATAEMQLCHSVILGRACSNCGRRLSAMAKFCPQCGRSVGRGLEVATVAESILAQRGIVPAGPCTCCRTRHASLSGSLLPWLRQTLQMQLRFHCSGKVS
jgi:zinc-ribbon domain